MTAVKEEIPAAVASTITGEFDPPKEQGDANSLFSEFLSEVTRDCHMASALMIGHVKANIRSGKEMLSISSTTEDGNVRSRSVFSLPVSIYEMTLNVIVYGIDAAVITKIITKRAESLGTHKLEMISESGCQDPECNDPDCTDTKHRIIRIG